MLNYFIFFFCTQLVVVITLIYSKKRLKHSFCLDIQQTTVLIPFKNEKSRILPLLNSINQSAINNKESNFMSNFQFIFIDDHSTDRTGQFILDNLDVSFQIVKLKKTSGKKYAIKYGVEQSKFDKLLTLDADVSFNDDYLQEILNIECKGLTILPVEMNGVSSIQKLFAVEFWFLQHLTFGLAGLGKFELCNGSNLLFTKKIFNDALKVRKDASIPSGDDVFLLKAVKKLNLKVKAINSGSLCVYTPASATFNNLFSQRLRWISKTKDISSIVMGSVVLVSNGIFLVCIYYTLMGNMYFSIPILIKVISELLSVNSPLKWVIVVLHQLYYPVYLLVLIVMLSSKRRVTWK